MMAIIENQGERENTCCVEGKGPTGEPPMKSGFACAVRELGPTLPPRTSMQKRGILWPPAPLSGISRRLYALMLNLLTPCLCLSSPCCAALRFDTIIDHCISSSVFLLSSFCVTILEAFRWLTVSFAILIPKQIQ